MSRSYDYYDKQKAMVKIAHALMARNWKVYGYKEDQSDSMTDYWSPANCDGIYENNGFILCVNVSDYTVKSYSGKEQYKYNYSACGLSVEDRKKIEKLEAMTQERGATAGEEANAKSMIEKIKSNVKSDKPEQELLYKYPVFQANPGRCTWHIEKDGALFEKGTNVYKFSDLPYEFDERTGKVNNNYYRDKKELTADEQKLVNDFQSFILKLERIVNNMNGVSDGTAETEQKAKEQAQDEKLIKVTVTETKTVKKPVEVTDRKEIQVNDLLSFDYHGHYWIVTDIWENSKGQRCVDYELLGSASRGYQRVKNTKRYYQVESKLLKEMESGKTKLYELKEVEEVTEVEKWVKAESVHKNTKKETKVSENKEEVKNTNNSEPVKVDENKNNYDFTISKEQDTRDDSDLWVVRLNDKLDREQWKEYDNFMRSKKGFYSKFKGGHIFKFDPIEILMPAEQQAQSNTIVLNYDEIEVTEEDRNNMEALLDYSSEIMAKLDMRYNDIFINQEYRKQLIEVLKNKVKLTKGLLKVLHDEYMSFEGYIITLLNSNDIQFYSENTINSNDFKNQVEKQEKKQDYSKLIEKINTQIESNNKRIQELSGDYKTNTWKRMKEQESRDKTRMSLEFDNRVLNYILDKIGSNSVTALEQALTVGTFRNSLHSYYSQHFSNKNYSCWREIQYPQIDYSCPLDGWYNKEVPTKQKRLNKAGIYNTTDLIKAVEEYKTIVDYIEQNNKIDPVKDKIKKLEREFKMCQKGDVNFTPKNLVEQMMDYADIKQGEAVLEPSAGIGNITDLIRDYTDNITCVEFNNSFSELLKLKGYKTICDDFLNYSNVNYFDKVIMNPPFSAEQEHIKQAYKNLKDGGRIVAITSNGWTFRSDKKTQDFREWLNSLTHEVVDIPSGQFEFTNVPVKILIIDKDINTDRVTA